GRDHGGDDGDRKFAHHPGVALRARVLAAGGDRERVRRGERRAAYLRAGGPGPDPLCGHRGAQHRGAPSGAHVAARSRAGSRMKSIVRGRAVNWVMTGLCALALGVALVPLISVLWLVISRGVAGLSWSFFTAIPAPVGETGGGVGNAIVGTLYIVG